MGRSNRNQPPRPNTMSPLGLHPATGPSKQGKLIKVTDNKSGWSSVANIPVPPEADRRQFGKSLGLKPVLLNGAEIKADVQAIPEDLSPELASTQPNHSEPMKAAGEDYLPRGSSFMSQETQKILEIDWYGARILIPCIRVVVQTIETSRSGQGWLLVEMAIDQKTKKPAWVPPVAVLADNGTISVPEFECSLDGSTYTCQVLNIEIWDTTNKKYFAVFNILNTT